MVTRDLEGSGCRVEWIMESSLADKGRTICLAAYWDREGWMLEKRDPFDECSKNGTDPFEVDHRPDREG